MRWHFWVRTGTCFFLLFAASCKNGNLAGQERIAGSNPPVETDRPNTDYKPAFAGQTRVNGVKTATPYVSEKLDVRLNRPWAVVPLPDGRLLITSIYGYMTIHDADGKELKKVTGFPEVSARGQGGMLDVVPDPQFSRNRMLYWSYAAEYEGKSLMAVAKGRLSADELAIENPTVIFRALPAISSTLHFGSRLLFDREGYLIVTTGERSVMEGRKQAQELASGLGKIFRINTDGQPAPGNPFLQVPNAMPHIYSYGHRNPQSLDIHPLTGDLWEAEFGPRGGDELNLIRPGKNYGWPVITYGIEYGGGVIGQGIQQREGMEQPVYYWDPVLSPSGMCFYAGDAIPEWKNNLFIGGLSSMHICRLVIENNRVTGEERLLTEEQQRFRDVAYMNGMLYAVTDVGRLYRIRKK